ncbi:hypothetical protein DL546_005396 [Coniochaeta pulveracea]|uniref:CFEM domain-containing protein n=1 Tax=Coniochaeta pulveracea TaxID=177199 RepID=A0A420YEA3_9PEZI|nr:hypothetical protein DL546_005396 [Coniochaeta pulveracea]
MQFTLSVITALVAGLSMAQQTSVPASAPAEPSAPAPVASSVAFTIMPYGAASAKPSISSSVVDPFPQVAMSSVAPNGVAPEVHQPRASIDPPYRPSAVIGHEVKDQAPFCCDPKLLPTCSIGCIQDNFRLSHCVDPLDFACICKAPLEFDIAVGCCVEKCCGPAGA